MAILSDTYITASYDVEVKESLSFKYLTSNSSNQNFKFFCASPISENVEIGFLKPRNEIFSGATTIKLGSLSNSLNLNLYVPNISTESGLFFRSNDNTNNTKEYGTIRAYRNSTGVLTENCRILVSTQDTSGRSNIKFYTRSQGSLSNLLEFQPTKTIISKNLLISQDLKIINSLIRPTYVMGVRYIGNAVTGYNRHTDYNNAFIIQGKVLIGDTSSLTYSEIKENYSYDSPDAYSVILRSSTRSTSAIYLYSGTNTADNWEIMYSNSSNASWGAHDLRFRYKGNTKGWLTDTPTFETITFTGQHRLKPIEKIEEYKNKIGYIVVSDGQYCNLNLQKTIEINEALPVVHLSNKRQQKNVIGVVSDSEDISDEQRAYVFGGLGTAIDKQPTEEDTRLYVNSLGEGGIWVCDINGNLENGDYITTCEIPGLGMKQDDEFLHNYTVAKITCDCDFDLESPIYICEEFQWEDQTYRRAFVGCTYHCG